MGDRIYARDNAHAAIALTGRNFVRLNPDSSLDMLTLSNEKTLLALRTGSAIFDIAALQSGELFEVATPCGAVDLKEPGLYQVNLDQSGNAIVTAMSGSAQVVGLGGKGDIQKGDELTVPCQAQSQAVVSRVEPRYAGSVIDEYYRYRYPRTYDGRYSSYYTYSNDPYYYDPYRRFTSYQYVSDYIPGVEDLDYYGDWQSVSDYGYCWHPRVDAGWSPYQSGYWATNYPFGLTWISYEPWGYAPYHYGRWTYYGNQWFWVPERIHTQPLYAPALVAFVPVTQVNAIGWVPLGPGDAYDYHYYDANWQPHYVVRSRWEQDRFVNFNVPNALVVVPQRDFARDIGRRMFARVDPQVFAHARPVLDPLAPGVNAELRQAALETRAARHRFDVPPGIAQRINSTTVVTSTAPVAPPFRRDLAQVMRAQQIPERARNQRLQWRDNRQAINEQMSQTGAQPTQANSIAADQARERRMAELAPQAARGDRSARQEMRQLQQQQVQQRRAERMSARQNAPPATSAPPVNPGQAQGERVGNDVRAQREAMRQQQQAQREAARQQTITTRQQQRNSARQYEMRGQANQQAGQQRAQQRVQQEAARGARHVRSQPPQPRAQPQASPPQAVERRQAQPPPQVRQQQTQQPRPIAGQQQPAQQPAKSPQAQEGKKRHP